MKYIYLLSLIFFTSKSVATVVQSEQQLDPEKHFISFEENSPFQDIHIIYYDAEAGNSEKLVLEKGDYYIGIASSSIKFKFSVDDNHKITGTYHDEDYWYEDEEYYKEDGEEKRNKLHQQIEIVNSKVIFQKKIAQDYRSISYYNQNEKTVLEKNYNDKRELITEYTYTYEEDDYLNLTTLKEYNIENESYLILNNNVDTKSYFSNKDKLIKVEHLSGKYLDIYNTQEQLVEKIYDSNHYFFSDNTIYEYPFTFKLKKKEGSYSREIDLKANIKYSITEDNLPLISFKTDEKALIQNEVKFYGEDNVTRTISVENSQPRFFEYKDINGELQSKGVFYKKDSSFVMTRPIVNDTITKVENKFYLIKALENKQITTAYLKKGGYVVSNEIENTLKKYDANNVLYSSKSLNGENKNDTAFDEKGEIKNSSYVKDGIKYNDIYQNGKLSQRSYTTIDGDYIEYFKKDKLYKVEQSYFNDEGILYVKEYNDDWEVKKDVEVLTINNENIKITDRDVLKKLVDLNPNNKLNWDLSHPNLNRLDGVTIHGRQDNDKSERVWKLIIAKEGIDILPKEIKHLKYLYFLSLSHNNLKVLPEGIGELKELEILYLENNQLTSLPKSLKNLEKLYGLNLSKNKFTEIPEVIFELKDNRFTNLEMEDNLISKVPSSIKKIQRMGGVNLAKNKFTSIPNALFNLPNLRRLKMNDNEITTIPKAIKNLKDLESLNLQSNKIKKLPLEIGTLKNLESLDVSYNNIIDLPDEITALENLTYLSLDENKIKEIPLEIHKLKKLQTLDISGNEIQYIPENVFKLDILSDLDIRFNKIKTLPNSLSTLKHLTDFRFNGNYIIYISEAICDMEYRSDMGDFFKDDETTCTTESNLYENYDAAVTKKILELFNEYKPTIEEAEEAQIKSVKTIIGDINNDGLSDGLLYFTLDNDTPPQIAIYTSNEGQVSVIGGFEPDFNFEVLNIENNIISLYKEGNTEKYILDYNSLVKKSK